MYQTTACFKSNCRQFDKGSLFSVARDPTSPSEMDQFTSTTFTCNILKCNLFHFHLLTEATPFGINIVLTFQFEILILYWKLLLSWTHCTSSQVNLGPGWKSSVTVWLQSISMSSSSITGYRDPQNTLLPCSNFKTQSEQAFCVVTPQNMDHSAHCRLCWVYTIMYF